MSDDKSWVYSCLIELMNAARAHQPPDFRDATLEACRKALDQYSAERAVIEAAREWLTVWRTDAGPGFDDDNVLAAAIEAMQAAMATEEGFANPDKG